MCGLILLIMSALLLHGMIVVPIVLVYLNRLIILALCVGEVIILGRRLHWLCRVWMMLRQSWLHVRFVCVSGLAA